MSLPWIPDEVFRALLHFFGHADRQRVEFERKPFDSREPPPRAKDRQDLRHPGRLKGWMRCEVRTKAEGWEKNPWRKCHTENYWAWYQVLTKETNDTHNVD